MSIDHQQRPQLSDSRAGLGDPGSASGTTRIGDYLCQVDRLLQHRIEELRYGGTPADDRSSPAFAGPTGATAAPQLSAQIDLAALLGSLISAGGKRLRPILSYLGFWVCGGEAGSAPEQEVITLGAALELLHSFALVHDDVMDQSSSRRGRPSTHVQLAQLHRELSGAGESERFGENIAILLGDLAHAEADRLITGCSQPLRAGWQTLIMELIQGQLADLAGAADRGRDPEQALQVARLKSGGYTIQRPVELGAITAGADRATLEPLSAYGREIGWAFALRDDVLGIWGDPEITGKPAGDDLVAGKPTMIIALAQQRLGRSDRSLLDRIGSADLGPDEVARLQQAIRDCGVEAAVEKMITQHVENGIGRLDAVRVARREAAPQAAESADQAIDQLASLAHQVAWRDR